MCNHSTEEEASSKNFMTMSRQKRLLQAQVMQSCLFGPICLSMTKFNQPHLRVLVKGMSRRH